LIDLNQCLEKGLIQKAPYSDTLVRESMEKAEELLGEAEQNLKTRTYNSVAVLAYSAAFNAARAMLYRDGYREKSHECVIRYLEAKHREIPSDLIALLDKYRVTRHGVLYDVRYTATGQEAREATEFAQEFIKAIGKALGLKG
jgi:uncharacterized protein (UPF0332 family)